MSDDYERGGWGTVVIYIAIFAMLGLVLWIAFPTATEPRSSTIPPSTTSTNEYTFNGTLGMVTYGHSWFGLGGADSSTLSFQNGTSIVNFNFGKDLAVTIGQKYEVQYKETVVTYFNVTKAEQNGAWLPYTNSTNISPQNVIWISDP